MVYSPRDWGWVEYFSKVLKEMILCSLGISEILL